jgi:hypothetical protein
MFELMYAPPMKILCMGINLQYRIWKYKRLSMEAYGGLKFLLIAPEDYIPNANVAAMVNKQGWYMNLGLIAQLNLGMILPFAELGGDGLITVGTEFNFRAVYRKPRSRYNLRLKPADN